MQSIDEEKIQEYLDKQGITSVDDPGIRKVRTIHFCHARIGGTTLDCQHGSRVEPH